MTTRKVFNGSTFVVPGAYPGEPATVERSPFWDPVSAPMLESRPEHYNRTLHHCHGGGLVEGFANDCDTCIQACLPSVAVGRQLDVLVQSWDMLRLPGETDYDLRQRAQRRALAVPYREPEFVPHKDSSLHPAYIAEVARLKAEMLESLRLPVDMLTGDPVFLSPQTCECAKEKFNFTFHERWCPDWVHPFEVAAMAVELEASKPKPDYRTHGDLMGMSFGQVKQQ